MVYTSPAVRASRRLEKFELDDKQENENSKVNAWDIRAQGVNNFVATCRPLDVAKQFFHAVPPYRLSLMIAQPSAVSDMELHAFHRNQVVDLVICRQTHPNGFCDVMSCGLRTGWVADN